MTPTVTHRNTHKASLFTMACLVKGEVVHVLEATDQADWRSKLVEYSGYALKKNKVKKKRNYAALCPALGQENK